MGLQTFSKNTKKIVAVFNRGQGRYQKIGSYDTKIDAITAMFYEDLRVNYSPILLVDNFVSKWKPTENYHPTESEEIRIHELGGRLYLKRNKEQNERFSYWFQRQSI